MNWATHIITELKDGKMAQVRPRGNSMSGKIESGNLVTLFPVDETSILEIGNIVLVKVKGKIYLHLIKAIKTGKEINSEQYLIGNNYGRINGWANRKAIYGVVINIKK
jgi:hypothetical protein